MSSGGGKGGGGSQQFNVFNSLLGVLRAGPVDAIYGLVHNGDSIFEGTITLTDDVTDITSSIPKRGDYFAPDGYCKIYRGTGTQPAPSTAFPARCRFLDTAHAVFYNVLFGLETYNAPTIEIIAGAKPDVPTDIVAAESNYFEDGVCNPAAFIASLLLSSSGYRLPKAKLNAASWLETSAALVASDDIKAATGCAPLITAVEDLRAQIVRTLERFDGYLVRFADGTLGCRSYQWGTVPEGAAVLDARHFDGRIKLQVGGWDDVPTGVIVTFTDRDRLFKTEVPVKVDNLLARQMRGYDARDTLPCPDVTRKDQAQRIGEEYLRRRSEPPLKISGALRRPWAKDSAGARLLPGAKLLIDVDPVTGGAGLAQLARVTQVADALIGAVKIDAEADLTAEAELYQAPQAVEEPQEAVVDPIADAVVIPLPFPLWAPLSIAVLATRPGDAVSGMKVAIGLDTEGTFAELGSQRGFAAKASLAADVAAEADTLRFTLAGGGSGPDDYLAGRTPGSNDTEARADTLLAVLLQLDEDDRVMIDADGYPVLEFVSIVERSAIDAGTHDYTVLRGRKGLPARDWTASGTIVYILPAINLQDWTHPDMQGNFTDPIYVRLTSFTQQAIDESDPIPERSVMLPTAYDVAPKIVWTTPAGASGETDASGDITLEADISDRQADLIGLRLDIIDSTGATVSTPLDLALTGVLTRSISQLIAGLPGDASTYRTYIAQLQARDAAGHLTTSQRTIVRIPTGTASELPPPSINPPGGNYDSLQTVTITASGGATEIHYALRAVGSPAPADPSEYTVYAGTVKTLTVGNQVLWARESDGAINSLWTSQTYRTRFVGGTGGGGWIDP